MCDLDQDEICNIVISQSLALVNAFHGLSYLAVDVSLRRLVNVIEAGFSINCVEFSQTAFDVNSGFYWDEADRIFHLNLSVIQRVVSHAQTLPEYGGVPLQQILYDVVGIYFFHELFHIPQGVSDFSVVQKLKAAMGKDKLGELDTHADFVAARAYTAIIAFEKNANLYDFAKILHGVLELSYTVGLRAFGIKPASHHKVNRALSIFLARERIIENIQNKSLRFHHCNAVHCFLSTELGLVVAYTLEGDDKHTTLALHEVELETARELEGAVQFGNLRYIEKQFRAANLAA